MPEHLFFFLGLALLLTHECDAVRCSEWRIFPLLARLDDRTGYQVFTMAHVPLYLAIFAGLFAAGGLNTTLVFALDLFFMIHVGLHWLLRNHPQNRFGSPFSWILIGGAGLAGALDLWVR